MMPMPKATACLVMGCLVCRKPAYLATHLSTSLQQLLHHCSMPIGRCFMQRRPPIIGQCVHIALGRDEGVNDLQQACRELSPALALQHR